MTHFFQEKFEPNDYDFWVMDIQGAELPVLKELMRLKSCKFIYIEVSREIFMKREHNGMSLKFLNRQRFKSMGTD